MFFTVGKAIKVHAKKSIFIVIEFETVIAVEIGYMGYGNEAESASLDHHLYSDMLNSNKTKTI